MNTVHRCTAEQASERLSNIQAMLERSDTIHKRFLELERDSAIQARKETAFSWFMLGVGVSSIAWIGGIAMFILFQLWRQ